MTNIKPSSRRTTPWSNCDTATPLQAFIDEVNDRNFERRHPKLSESGETDLINSYKPDCCRHCVSVRIKRFGKTGNGVHRYRCNYCGRTFTPITNTIFDNHKVSLTEWVDFLLSLFGFSSLNLASKSNRNACNTTRYWLDKVFLVVQGTQNDIMLSGKVQLDETYCSVRSNEVQRKADGLKHRGTSRNQHCIGAACDSSHIYLQIEGMGTPTIKSTLETFSGHILPGSLLVHGTGSTHARLIERLSLEQEIYDAGELKELKDKDNPLNGVNQVCNLPRSS